MGYNPPFDITNEIVSLVAEIVELATKVKATTKLESKPTLRRENRIKTIHGSLAIEQNTLSLEQVTAVLNGKRVLAPPKDIEEVKNAFEIYDIIETLNPYSIDDLLKAHGVLMKGLVKSAGAFREEAAGVADYQTGDIIHVGTLPQYVPKLTQELLNWVEQNEAHPLIKSCVFHYEFEVIHPFLDGNGRLGRLWHSLLLAKWNPIFSYIPIESMIYQHQNEYYKCFNFCNINVNSTKFIVFMLSVIKEALQELNEQTCSNGTSSEQVEQLLRFCTSPKSRAQMQEFMGISGRKAFQTKILKPLLESGQLKMTIPDKPNSSKQKYIAD